ncbi:MAG: hypothetical protein CMH81_06965 [Nitrospiraceae bacterium]|nr:hypothetical protein [Nitrospiraceae bacterium]
MSDDQLQLTLPIPPSINHQYATVNGRRILSAESRSYKQLVGGHVLIALAKNPKREHLRTLLQSHALILSMWFYLRTALRRDLDSGLKITQDAICEALELNDNRVVEIHLHKKIDRNDPRLEVILAPLGDDTT